MNELTDEQIGAAYQATFNARTDRAREAPPAHRLVFAFARAVIAADRELQDAKLANAPTDGQIDEALKVFACTVIGADRAAQDARHLEELRAYELTCSNLRAQVEAKLPARMSIPEDHAYSTDRTFAAGWNACLEAMRELLSAAQASEPERKPMDFNAVDKIVRDAQIAYCLDKVDSAEVAIIRAVEAHHGIVPAPEDKP